MKKVLLSLFLAATLASNAYACGGGQQVQLNDDSILTVAGIYYPITDPNNEAPFDLEESMDEIRECQAKLAKAGNFAQMLGGTQCPRAYLTVTDSQGNRTHKVNFWMSETNYAQYTVTDLKTGESKRYEGQAGARGSCGLQEVQ